MNFLNATKNALQSRITFKTFFFFIFFQNSKFSVKSLLRLSQNVNKLINSAYSAQLAGDDKAARLSGLSNEQGRRKVWKSKGQNCGRNLPLLIWIGLTCLLISAGGGLTPCSDGPNACSLCWVPGWSYLSNLTASRRQSVKFKRSEIKCKLEYKKVLNKGFYFKFKDAKVRVVLCQNYSQIRNQDI